MTSEELGKIQNTKSYKRDTFCISYRLLYRLYSYSLLYRLVWKLAKERSNLQLSRTNGYNNQPME